MSIKFHLAGPAEVAKSAANALASAGHKIVSVGDPRDNTYSPNSLADADCMLILINAEIDDVVEKFDDFTFSFTGHIIFDDLAGGEENWDKSQWLIHFESMLNKIQPQKDQNSENETHPSLNNEDNELMLELSDILNNESSYEDTPAPQENTHITIIDDDLQGFSEESDIQSFEMHITKEENLHELLKEESLEVLETSLNSFDIDDEDNSFILLDFDNKSPEPIQVEEKIIIEPLSEFKNMPEAPSQSIKKEAEPKPPTASFDFSSLSLVSDEQEEKIIAETVQKLSDKKDIKISQKETSMFTLENMGDEDNSNTNKTTSPEINPAEKITTDTQKPNQDESSSSPSTKTNSEKVHEETSKHEEIISEENYIQSQYSNMSEEGVLLVNGGIGGPGALVDLMINLPSNFNASVVINQELKYCFLDILAKNLQKHTKLKITVGKVGDEIQKGVVTILDQGTSISKIGDSWYIEEGTLSENTYQLGPEDSLLLLSGTTNEWFMPSMDAVTQGTLVLGQDVTLKDMGDVINNLEDLGLIKGTIETLSKHISDKWGILEAA